MTFSKRLLVLFIGFSFANLGFSKSKECSKIEIDRASIALEFTAYKFSEKAGVGGKFKKFETLQSKNQAASLDEWGTLFDGIEISTKVLSLETGDKSRDLKIINAFFGNMSDQRKIEGVLSELKMKKDSNSEYSAKLTMKMNGVSRVYENVALKREKDKV